MKRINLIGQVFGRLTVVAEAGLNSRRQSLWECRCSCGEQHIVLSTSLRSGHTTSCGCYNKERFQVRSLVHGHARQKKETAEYRSWQHAKARCINPNVWNYKNYGGRGIKMCEKWLNSFESFLADMGPRPSSKHSLDRWPDHNGDYEPSNCRWATAKEQQNNRRNNRRKHGI